MGAPPRVGSGSRGLGSLARTRTLFALSHHVEHEAGVLPENIYGR